MSGSFEDHLSMLMNQTDGETTSRSGRNDGDNHRKSTDSQEYTSQALAAVTISYKMPERSSDSVTDDGSPPCCSTDPPPEVMHPLDVHLIDVADLLLGFNS